MFHIGITLVRVLQATMIVDMETWAKIWHNKRSEVKTLKMDTHFMKVWTLGGVFPTRYEKPTWNMVSSTVFLPKELATF